MPPSLLIVRADASVAMGTGHVMRCVALAQAWQDQGGECIFVMAESTASSEARVHDEEFEFSGFTASPGSPQDAAQLVQLARERGAAWVVLDGYQFDVEYQRSLKATGTKLLVVDDTGHAGAYVADLVLDQNAQVTESLYQDRQAYTRLLLGFRYALLRREFKAWRDWKRQIVSAGRKVLITIGGSDPNNFTLVAIHALRLLAQDQMEATVVIGGSNPYAEQIEEELRGTGGSTRLLKNTSNMPELMADADVGISGAGSTCWEMCFMGLPAIVVDVAENQRAIAQELERVGIAIHLGSNSDVTAEAMASKLKKLLASHDRRTEMSERGRNLVDGSGSERVVAAMISADLRLRRARPKDCELLYTWVNDPEVRANSFSSEVISRERHEEWFRKKLADSNAILYLVIDPDESPIGQVRYDVEGSRALISISLGAGFRGKGYGGKCLSLAVEELFRSTSATVIDAYVKPANETSLQMFLKAGFRRQQSTVVAGQPAVHLILEKNRSS
jgi:UDP-2,4-diacetamido-2,4,6-trideoxy-beta-L-altropyranose hydrolase